jgi:hypothetical protein
MHCDLWKVIILVSFHLDVRLGPSSKGEYAQATYLRDQYMATIFTDTPLARIGVKIYN